MEIIHGSTYIFSLALLFTLLTERLLELIKSVLDYLDSRYGWHRFWTRRAERLAQKLERRLKMNNRKNIKFYAFIIDKASGILVNGATSKKTGVPTISGDAVRAFHIKTIMKLLGAGIGLLFAFGLQLDIVSNWKNLMTENAIYSVKWYGLLITGIGIGLGSAPVHKLITMLEHIEKSRSVKQEKTS